MGNKRKKNRESLLARRLVVKTLRDKGAKLPGCIKDRDLAKWIENHLGLKAPDAGAAFSSPKHRIVNAARVIAGLPPRTFKAKARTAQPDKIRSFYKSYEWAAARMDALERSDGRCECCGRSKHDDVVLNVDHIRPLKTHWHLRLDPENHQVLCGQCNRGKGNRYETDWREPRLSVLLGERI